MYLNLHFEIDANLIPETYIDSPIEKTKKAVRSVQRSTLLYEVSAFSSTLFAWHGSYEVKETCV